MAGEKQESKGFLFVLAIVLRGKGEQLKIRKM